MLALGFGSHIRVRSATQLGTGLCQVLRLTSSAGVRLAQIWKDALSSTAKSPYMSHELPGKLVEDVRFRPYDDILAIGHDSGVTTMVRANPCVTCEALADARRLSSLW